jgi:hypothetical protein
VRRDAVHNTFVYGVFDSILVNPLERGGGLDGATAFRDRHLERRLPDLEGPSLNLHRIVPRNTAEFCRTQCRKG